MFFYPYGSFQNVLIFIIVRLALMVLNSRARGEEGQISIDRVDILDSSVIGLKQRCDSYERLTPVAKSCIGATLNAI